MGGATGSPGPQKAKKVLAVAVSNKNRVTGAQIRSEGIRIPASNI